MSKCQKLPLLCSVIPTAACELCTGSTRSFSAVSNVTMSFWWRAWARDSITWQSPALTWPETGLTVKSRGLLLKAYKKHTARLRCDCVSSESLTDTQSSSGWNHWIHISNSPALVDLSTKSVENKNKIAKPVRFLPLHFAGPESLLFQSPSQTNPGGKLTAVLD